MALTHSAPRCRRCGLALVGPTAQRLWWIDSELRALRGRERVLAQERPGVLAQLRRESEARSRSDGPEHPAPAPGRAPDPAPNPTPERRAAPADTAANAAQAVAPPEPAGPGHDGASQGRPGRPDPGPAPGGEVSRRSAQNVILALGGLLVGIAALVFAIWTWSDMGTGARAAVLGLTTLAFAVLARPLHRRGLHATAETFGAVAAGLLCVDALALWLLSDRLTNGPGYTGAALTVISALLVLYPALVPLRSPRILAALFAQPVPVLLVIALPTDGNPGWLLAVLAATALVDGLVVRRLGSPRRGVPVRTLHVSALILWGLVLAVTGVVVLASTSSSGSDPLGWWSLATTLLLAGATGLLLDRRRGPGRTDPGQAAKPRTLSVYAIIGLGALALVPLVAGPAHLPVLPRLPVLPWSLEPAAMAAPAVELLQLDRASTLPPLNLVYLAGILVATGLVLGTVRLLRRSALSVTLSLTAPTTLLALPLLLGLPQTVAAVWALVVGGCLVLGSAVLRRWTGSVPVVTGTLTLVTGLVWALPERYTTLACLLLLAVTALVCAAGARRFTEPGHSPEPGGRAATLYMGSVLLWGLSLLLGTAYLLGNRGAEGTVQAQWWLLTGAVLLCGTTALLLSRVRAPSPLAVSSPGQGRAADPRPLFTLAGLALLPGAPLLALPERSPALTLFSPRAPWSEPAETMWAPVNTVLGLPAQPGVLSVVGSALGVLLVGALVTGLVALIDRRWLPAAPALTVPPSLVPLPVLAGAPFAAAVVWTLLVGAALFLWTSRLRPGAAWLPGVTGSATMLLALAWSLPQQHTTLLALLLAAAVVVLSALAHRNVSTAPPRSGTASTAVIVYGLTLVAWGAVLAFGSIALVASATVGAPDQTPSWLLSATALLLGAAALVLGRTRGGGVPSPFGIAALLLLAAVPLVAGPRGLPTVPALTRALGVFEAPVSAMLEPARAFVGLPVPADTLTALATAAGLLIAGILSLGAVLLLDRRLLTPAIALVGPLTLVPLPVLAGAPFAAAVVWTLLVGAALFLWASRLWSPDAWLPGVTGLATMLLALAWSLPQQHTTLVTLLLAAAVVVLSAPARRRLSPADGAPPASLAEERLLAQLTYGLTAIAWGAVLAFGFTALVASATVGAPGRLPWWLLGAATLLLGATALVLGRPGRGRAPEPVVPGGTAPFSVAGLFLLVAVPLVAGPRGLPALAAFSRTHPLHEAPLSALLEPAHVFVGLPAPADALSMFTVPLGLLAAGTLALGTVLLLDRGLLLPTAALVVPLTLVPLPVALGAPFLAALVWTLAVGALLLTGAALLRGDRTSWMPWLTGLCTLALALSWALSERYSTVGVLLAAAVIMSVSAAPARTRFVAVASTSAATAATGAFSLTLLLALDAPVEYAAFGPIVVATAVAAVAPRLRGPLVTAAEVPAALWATAALLLTVLSPARPEVVAVALASVGVVSLASAVRPDRRWLAVVGGLLMFLALWTALAAWDVSVPEAYTVPPAIAFLIIGWEWSRRTDPAPSSWLAHGGGLALLLGPTVWQVLISDDTLWRLPAVLATGLAVTLWGLRQRRQAALVLGGLTLLTTSLRAFGPPLWELTRLMPNWLPFAVIGLVLLYIGARYEASLARLRQVGRLLSQMR
ncbi:SCO7613 C-terminal domain-containing membrane protein [Nocardiopsis terrae]